MTKKKRRILIIDPPSGWRYGFPKVLPKNVKPENLRSWFVENGYPESEVDMAIKWSRSWYQEVEVKKCDFCAEACGNDWCVAKEAENED